MNCIQSIELGGFHSNEPRKDRFAVITIGAASNALFLAKALCTELGISIGDRDRDNPMGLAWGKINICKWHTLSETEIAQLDGTMSAADFNAGPIVIRLNHVRDGGYWNRLVEIAEAARCNTDQMPQIPDWREPLEHSEDFKRKAEAAYYAIARGDAEPARRLLCDVLGRVA